MKPTIYKQNGAWRLTFRLLPNGPWSYPPTWTNRFETLAEALAELKSFYDAHLVYRNRQVG